MDYKLRLTCKTKDGKEVSGVYPYMEAIARQQYAISLPNCQKATLDEVCI